MQFPAIARFAVKMRPMSLQPEAPTVAAVSVSDMRERIRRTSRLKGRQPFIWARTPPPSAGVPTATSTVFTS